MAFQNFRWKFQVISRWSTFAGRESVSHSRSPLTTPKLDDEFLYLSDIGILHFEDSKFFVELSHHLHNRKMTHMKKRVSWESSLGLWMHHQSRYIADSSRVKVTTYQSGVGYCLILVLGFGALEYDSFSGHNCHHSWRSDSRSHSQVSFLCQCMRIFESFETKVQTNCFVALGTEKATTGTYSFSSSSIITF
jgi:hypothetical protein